MIFKVAVRLVEQHQSINHIFQVREKTKVLEIFSKQ